MKRLMTISLAIMITLVFVAGCATTPFSKSSSGSSAKKAEPGSYSQVPASMRGDVKEAEYDRKLAGKNVKLAEEKVKLAELKKERGILGAKYAEYNKKRADIVAQKAEAIVEGKKMEAVDNAGLGDKEDNIKQIAKLKEKELDITIDEIKIRADIDTTALKLKKLDKRIRAQSNVVAKAGGAGTKSKAVKKKSKKISKKRKK